MPGLPPELKELAQAVEVHRERLRRLIEVRGEGGLQELYEDLRRDLLGRLSGLVAAGRGETMTAHQMRGLMVQVEEGLAGFSGRFADHMADVGADAQIFAGEEAIDELKVLSKELRGSLIPLAVEEAAVMRGLIADVEPSLLSRYRLQSMNYSIETITAIESELSVGLATGRTLQENIDAIAPVIQGTEYQAERIVRTEMLEAHTRTSQETLKRVERDDLPGLKQQWITIGWTPRENSGLKCKTCGPLHGRVRALGEAFGRKPNGEEIYKPPAHPNCLCIPVGWHPEWTEEEAEQVADRVAGRQPKK